MAAEMDIVKPLEVRGLSSAERLVSPEAHDGQTEGVHGKLIVLHVLAKDISDSGCPSFPFEFRMISGIRVHCSARIQEPEYPCLLGRSLSNMCPSPADRLTALGRLRGAGDC